MFLIRFHPTAVYSKLLINLTRVIFFPRSNCDESTVGMSNTSLSVNNGELKAETPNVKKRHRRMKSSNIKNQECEGVYNIYIVYNRRHSI